MTESATMKYKTINTNYYIQIITPSVSKYKNVFDTMLVLKTFLYFGTEGVELRLIKQKNECFLDEPYKP